MTEKSYWWTTSGTPSGHQEASYDQSELSTIVSIMAACSGHQGVAYNYLNSLEVTANGANTVAVNTGAAVVDGKPYKNDASLNVNIPSTASQLRIDRIVLRCNWSAYTVTVTRIQGTEASSPSPPAITETSGTTYDVKLARVQVNSSGAVTVTDERDWALADGIMILTNRQGGSSTDWGSPGTTNYTVSDKVLMQLVSYNFGSLAGGTYQSYSLTFPRAYNSGVTPLIVAGGLIDAAANGPSTPWVDIASISNTGVTIKILNEDSVPRTCHGHYIVIGPMPEG